jgi:hypothetical protein
MTESPYPAERNVKMELAFAWLTANSSSTRGGSGEDDANRKLTNQTKGKKRRRSLCPGIPRTVPLVQCNSIEYRFTRSFDREYHCP